MNVRRTLIAATMATLALGLAPSYASHSETGEYSIGTTPGLSLVCSPDCLGEPGLNIGGYTFAPNGEVPSLADIADSSGAPVSFTICQDFNDALCGEAGEPRVEGCAVSADLTKSVVTFTPDRETSVFVRIADRGCVGPALGGTITMHFAPSS